MFLRERERESECVYVYVCKELLKTGFNEFHELPTFLEFDINE